MDNFWFFYLFIAFFVFGCGRATPKADDRLYGTWYYSGASFNDKGKMRTSTVGGDVTLKRDGQAEGVRVIGSVSGPLGGPFTVKGDRLTLGAEPDITYKWAIKEGDYQGKPAWVLSLDSGSMVYLLLRDLK